MKAAAEVVEERDVASRIIAKTEWRELRPFVPRERAVCLHFQRKDIQGEKKEKEASVAIEDSLIIVLMLWL